MDPDFATCPYNPSHRVLKLRLQHHIVRCRQSYRGPPMKPCPFNASHIIRVDNYAEHVQACCDARLIEGHRYIDNPGGHGALGSTQFHFAVSQDESWDSSDQQTEINPSDLSTPDDSIIDADDTDDDEFCPDYDENEEPLQGYFYERRSLTGKQCSSSETTYNTECLESVFKYAENTIQETAKSKDKSEEDTTGSQRGLAVPPKSRLLLLLGTLAKRKSGTDT